MKEQGVRFIIWVNTPRMGCSNRHGGWCTVVVWSCTHVLVGNVWESVCVHAGVVFAIAHV